jgi:uncharacterized protein YcbK (DUF882 family)
VGDLSAHFSRSEFADHRTGEVRVDPELVTRLEALRAIVGRPCVIVSGFRSKATNATVGGARNSQHLYGRAADLQPGYATVGQAQGAGFTGIGHCRGWAVHVDVRPGPSVEFPDC